MNDKEQNLHTPQNNLDDTIIIKINHPSASFSSMEFNCLTYNNNSKEGQISTRKRKLDNEYSITEGCTFDKIPRILLVDCMKNQPQQPQESTTKHKKELIDVKINITCNDCQLSFLSLQKFLGHLKMNAELEIKENIPPTEPQISTSRTVKSSSTRKRKKKATNINPNPTSAAKTKPEPKQSSSSALKCDENVTSESYTNPISFHSEIETNEDEPEIKTEYSDEEEKEIQIDDDFYSPSPENTDNDNDNDPLYPSPSPPSTKSNRKARSRINVDKKSVSQSPSSKGESKSMCEKCGKSFSRKQLVRHLQDVHLRPFFCPIESCEKSYGSKKQLERHVRSHSTELPFKCPECPRAFKQPDDLKRHSLVHTVPDGLPFKCPVENCSAAYSRSICLWEHKKLKHSSSDVIKPHKCTWPGCSSSFFKKSCLTKHRVVHADERPFNCKVEGCSATFKSEYRLSKHMIIHSGKRPFSCEVEGCGATFQTNNHLKQHGAVHSKEFNHLCELCGKSFKTNGGLRQHEAHVHPEASEDPKPPKVSFPKNFPCDHSGCGRFFTSLSRLTNHQKLHERVINPLQATTNNE